MARKQCRVDATGSPPAHEDDDLITIYLKAAREYCEQDLGTAIAPTGVQIALTAFPSDQITLQSGPVISIMSITYFDTNEVEQVIDPSVYTLDTSGQLSYVRLNAGQEWPDSGVTNDPIRVNYVIGYTAEGDSPQTTPLPTSVKLAILLLRGHFYTHRESTIAANLAELPMGVCQLLSPFKLRSGFA